MRTLGGRQLGHRRPERVQQRLVAEEQPARLVDLADHHARAERRACPSSSGIRPSSAASSVDLPEPFAPGDRHPVGPVDLQVDRPEREVAAAHHRAAQRRPRPRRPGARRRSPSAAPTPCAAPRRPPAARSAARSGGPWRPASRVVSPRKLRPILSLSVALRRALRTPFSIQARCVRARASSAAPACRRTPRSPRGRAGGRPRAPPGRPRSRRRSGCTCCWARSSSSTRVTVRARNSRSWLTSTVPARSPVTKCSSRSQAVEVEVVGRLVEQEDVVAAEQQRRHAGPGRLAAGQRGHRLVEVDRQAEVGGHLLGALVQVGAAEGEPALQRRRRRRRRRPAGPRPAPRRRRPARPAPRPTPVRRARKSRTVSPGRRSRLLRQVADGRGRRAERDRALPRPAAARPGYAAAWTCRRR